MQIFLATTIVHTTRQVQFSCPSDKNCCDFETCFLWCVFPRYSLLDFGALFLLCQWLDFLRRLGEVGVTRSSRVRLRVELRANQLPATANQTVQLSVTGYNFRTQGCQSQGRAVSHKVQLSVTGYSYQSQGTAISHRVQLSVTGYSCLSVTVFHKGLNLYTLSPACFTQLTCHAL